MMDRRRLENLSGSGFLPGFVQFVLVVLCSVQDLVHLGLGILPCRTSRLAMAMEMWCSA